MEITEVTSESKGQLKFSHKVNIMNAKNRFAEIFNVYVKNVVKEIEELELIEITDANDTENTINFTCTFKEPYLLGLLNKKSDMLTFEIKNETDVATNLLILNITGEEMASNTTSKRVEMQFDFRSKISFNIFR